MTDADHINLLVLFWVAFTLAFFVIACLWRLSVSSGALTIGSKHVNMHPLRMASRIVLTAVGAIGVLAAASFVGTLLKQVSGAEFVLLGGALVGVIVSFTSFPWSNRT